MAAERDRLADRAIAAAGTVFAARALADYDPAERWWERGACRTVPTDVFYPTAWGHRRADTLPALRVCWGCPVRAQCLAEALVNREWGIWGGTTEDERTVLVRRLGLGALDRRRRRAG